MVSFPRLSPSASPAQCAGYDEAGIPYLVDLDTRLKQSGMTVLTASAWASWVPACPDLPRIDYSRFARPDYQTG